MGPDYPLIVHDYRTLPGEFDGPVFIWDVDKTYLTTPFSSLRGLLRIPMEFAVDKRAVPGMPEILRGLRRGPGPGFACAPLYFVTASPPLLRGVLEQKMLLDGVEHDGITFKDWGRILKQGRPRRLREQMGFKLCALLEGRRRRPMAAEYLFGDDVEQDADAFHLYARLIHGELSVCEADATMANAGVSKADRQAALALVNQLPLERGRVKRIFIHLERRTPPEKFLHFGKVVAPVKSAFQLGLALYALGLIDSDVVLQCREAVFSGKGPHRSDLDADLADAIERRLLTGKKARKLNL